MKEHHKQVYEYVLRRTREGCSPSLREICRDMGISSTSTAARYVNSLVERGFLERTEGGSRNIRPAGMGAARLPVIRRVEDGRPVTDPEEVAEYIYFQPLAGKLPVSKSSDGISGELFAYRVPGDDLSGAGILAGDVAVLETVDTGGSGNAPASEKMSCTVKNGDIVLASFDGRLCLRRFFYENGHYRLEAENAGAQPVFLERCTVAGRIAGIIRYIGTEE